LVKRVVGSCSGCGACCKLLAVPLYSYPVVDPARRVVTMRAPAEIGEDYGAFLEARGLRVVEGKLEIPYQPKDGKPPVRISTYGGQNPVAYVDSTCPHLQGDNGCDLHGTDAMPRVCRSYPTVKDDLSAVPECSYTVVVDA
jgi:Fe-S-cluster containining protein